MTDKDLAAAGAAARPARKIRRGWAGGCGPVPGGRVHLPSAARDRGQTRWRAPDVLSPRSGHDHVEWVGGQGHYDLGYASAIRLGLELL